MTRLLAQLSALLGLVWLAVQLGRDAAVEHAALTAAVVAMTAYVAGMAVLGGVRAVTAVATPPPPSAETEAPPAA